MEDENLDHGDEINEITSAKMALSNEKAVLEAHASGWKLDNDGWYVKPVNPINKEKAVAFIKAMGFRAFLAIKCNYDVGMGMMIFHWAAIMWEAEDALSLDLHLLLSQNDSR